MKKWLLGINLVGLLVIGAVVFNVGPVEQTKPLIIHSAAKPPQTATPRVATSYHIGDIQHLAGVDILLNNVYTVDGKYFMVDFTVTNHSGAALDAVWLRRSVSVYVDTEDWRGPVADTFSDIPNGATQTGHVQFTWANPEVIDTVRFNSLLWYL